MIYFIKIKEFNFVKIGYTSDTNYETRFRTLKMHLPFDLELLLAIKGYKDEEAVIHSMFHEDRYRGEWFNYSDNMKQYVQNHPNPINIKFSNRVRRFTYTQEQIHTVRIMYHNGEFISKIAEYLECSKAACRKLLNSHSIKRIK